MKAYLANALFSESEQLFNEYLALSIRSRMPEVDLYVPQENPDLNDKSGYADSLTIFNEDNAYLDAAEVLFAVIDGSDIDPGVAAEIGRFALMRELEVKKAGASKRKIFGLFTDVRANGRDNQRKIDALIEDGTENQFIYRNLYVVGAMKEHGRIFHSSNDMLAAVETELRTKK